VPSAPPGGVPSGFPMNTDLDKLMNETAFEEAVVVRGVRLVLAHPLSVHSTGRRTGFIGRLIALAGRGLVRLVGADIERATRRELVGCFCPEDRAAARRVLSQLTAVEVVLLYRVVNEKAAAWLGRVVLSAQSSKLEAQSSNPERGEAWGTGRTVTVEQPGVFRFMRGGGRVAAHMGGGLWGKAYADEVTAKAGQVASGEMDQKPSA